MTGSRPFLSVVVPAHRGEQVLRESLPSLLASTFTRHRWELIVVDDASPDRTADVAREYADRVVRLDGRPRGPAYARNRGTEAATGEIVVFIDADVCVHPDTLARFAEAFESDPELTALFGSYDDDPHAPGIVSQFRNLLHHHTHHMNPGPAETFWAGCGAVRRDALIAVGMMDAWHFPRPQIEDIELGRRLRRAGYRIELRPDILCTHLKHWTLTNMVVTDFRDRGVPWMWLLLSEGISGTPATLNLRFSEKLCTALVAVTALALAAALVFLSAGALVVAVVSVLLIVILNRGFYGTLVRRRGVAFAGAALPLHLIFYFTGGIGAVAGFVSFHVHGVPRPVIDEPVMGQHADPSQPPRDRPESSVWAMAAARSRK